LPPPPPQARVVVTEDRPEGEAAGNDHDLVVHKVGVTYFDVQSVPIAQPQVGGVALGAGGITSTNLQAPVVGIRYWLNQRFGIDGGIGLGFAGGSQESVNGNTDTTVSKESTTAFVLHVGVPISLYDAKHYSFLVIPYGNLGFASGTFKGTTPNQNLDGFLGEIGVRAGAEIHFGFIGIPQLALQATVGLSYNRTVFKDSAGGNSASDGTNTFGTNLQANPWAIFTNAISATYYL
jgi:hypothetical protein